MNSTFTTTYSGLEIAVIGMSGRFPGAKNIDEFWDNLKNGIETITFFSEDELIKAGVGRELVENKNYAKVASVIDNIEYFDAFFFGYTPKEAEIMNPQIRIFYECVYEALEDAGYAAGDYTGEIGLYAGASNNYEWDALTIFSGKSEELGSMHANTLSNKDNLATRISYKLNLTGPAVTLRTACSTALVAIHLACRALLTKECDIALGGGVSITNLTKKGYLYQEGLIMSPNGQCRPFDANANGTFFGDGAGVVVLKKLNNAIADGDNIYAIIKGSAINNDGYRKVAYTAPSVEGQAVVIKSALRIAGVDPGNIGFLETHGTGTNLGDTVEIEALKIVFGPTKKNFCALGSVKSNFRHLEAASGVAAFIKTVLVLKYKLIPATLHFETANPEIDFDNSSFYINTKLVEFKNVNRPLRAGVSSFGFGGTNSHAVLEEAPEINKEERSASKRPYLILLSAKTLSALDKSTENLVKYLKNNPDSDLADAVYTLQVGRKTFPYKRTLVCSDIGEAISELSSPGSIKVRTFNSKKENPLIIFVFQGLGSQYVNMGRELYENEPVFRDEMNKCFEILKPLVNYDIKEILYPGNNPAPGIHNSLPKRPPEINQVEFSQPIIFIFEYVLAVLLMKWGINPHAMIGYSLGEYTAACISGVFSLEDALKLVISRGQLLQKIPPGVMLSVPLPVEDVTPLLSSELSIAIDNGPSCIVAGLTEAVFAFEEQMKERKILSVRVPASRAIHSKMMEPISKEFERVIAQITLNKPQIPYISNVTGTWIKDEEVVKPAYWVKHLKQTVQFAAGMKELAKEDKSIFLEIGPGQDLSALILRYLDKDADQRVFHFIRQPHQEISDVYFLMKKIGRLWLYGVKVDFNRFYDEEVRFRISLPTYPFERKYHWIKGDPLNVNKGIMSPKTISKRKNIDEWFYIPSWKRSSFTVLKEIIMPERTKWLVFMDDLGVGNELTTRLKQDNQDVIRVEPGTTFEMKSENLFIIDPKNSRDYILLFDWFKKNSAVPTRIIHLWSLIDISEKKYNAAALDKCLDFNFYSLVYLAKVIQTELTDNMKIEVITTNIFEISGEEKLFPEKSIVLGPCKVIPQESPNIRCRCIDIDLTGLKSPLESNLVNHLYTEIISNFPDLVVAHRNNRRWIQIFNPLPLEAPLEKKGKLKLKHGGVYLITGGMGMVGIILAKYLLKEMHAKLILTGISEFPPRDKWEQWLAEKGEDDRVSGKITKIMKLENLGGEVLVLRADAANEKQMQEVVHQAESKFGPLNGVIHAAGVVRGDEIGTINKLSKSNCDRHFAPKLFGLLVLDKVLAKKELDFCVLTSSISCILGGLGLTAYATANIFMDAYTHYRNKQGASRWTSINWDRWNVYEKKSDARGLLASSLLEQAIEPEEGIKILLRILSGNDTQVINSTGDLELRINQWIKLESIQGQDNTDKELSLPTQPRPDLTTPYVAPRNWIEQHICDIWQELFGIELIGIEDDFFEIGGDSLTAIRLLSILQKDFEATLTDLFQYQTISAQAAAFPYTKNMLLKKIEDAKNRAQWVVYEDEFKRMREALEPQMQVYREKLEPYRSLDLSARITYRSILLTGVTGYLGVHLMQDLLHGTTAGLYLLVRGKSPEEAEQRVIHLTKFYFDEAFYEMYRSRIHIVNGDLGLDRFGLSGEEYNRLSGEIDCIINSAAFVKYYGHYEDFVRVNVDGVRRMIEFALTGKKKDLNHISTMNVVLGEFKDKEFVLCTEFYQNLEQDINEFSYYLQTKYKGEKLVADARAKGLNASVYRVGNLVFESATGKFQENIEDNDFYTRIKSFVKLGVMVDSDIPVLNFTFVDQASKAIVLLHDQENLRGETHHLFNSNRVSLNQLTEMLREVGESLRTISLLEFIDILKNNYDNPDLRQYIEKIILLTGVFTDPVGTVITQTTEKTDLILDRLGFRWPQLNKEHIEKMAAYCKEVGFL